MSIAGKGANNILNWKTFSVENGEKVQFLDKNNYLNIVNGVDISRIYGTISGGNYVYLVNPYGVLLGQGTTLDNVGSFIASTRDISDINHERFLENPADVTGVLYSDDRESRNLDYYPLDSPYVPKISVAEINLTNVPKSATQIVLDGPGGVVLKSEALLNQVTYLSTREIGGEIGIGQKDFNKEIQLTNEQKNKIYLINGNQWKSYNDFPNTSVLVPYEWIYKLTSIPSSRTYRNYMLVQDNSNAYSNRVDEYIFRGTLEGLGYKISYESNTGGLFSEAAGTVRNLRIQGIVSDGQKNIKWMGYVRGFRSALDVCSYRPGEFTWASDYMGIFADKFSGSMSNVTSSGYLYSYLDTSGGIVGKLYTENPKDPSSEIRNSHNEAIISVGAYADARQVGGITGITENASLYNVHNEGEISSSSFSGGTTGGITGLIKNTSRDGLSILSAYNTGKVSCGGRLGISGGIVGTSEGVINIGDTYNFGKVKGTEIIGGILGRIENGAVNPIITSYENNTLESYYDSNSISTINGTSSTVHITKYGNNIDSTQSGINMDQLFSKYADAKNSAFIPSGSAGIIPINNKVVNSGGSTIDGTITDSQKKPTPNSTNMPTDENQSVTPPHGGNVIPSNPIKGDNSGDTPNGVLPVNPSGSSKGGSVSNTAGDKTANVINNYIHATENEANISKKSSWWEKTMEMGMSALDYVFKPFIKTETEVAQDDLKNAAKQIQKEIADFKKKDNSVVRTKDISGDIDKVPNRIVDDFVSAINNAIKYSNKDIQKTGNMYVDIEYGVDGSIPRVLDDYHGNIYSEEGVTYRVNYIGSVLVGNSVMATIQPGKSNRIYQLHWSGGSSEQFISDLKDVGFDAFQAVIDACASDSLSILKVINDDALTDAYQVKVEGLTNPISKKALKQIVAKVAGNEFLDRVANIAIDAI